MKRLSLFCFSFLISYSLCAEELQVETHQRKTFFPNGSIQTLRTFVSSPEQSPLPHGEQIEFYPNGSIRARGEMVLGKRHGKWVFVNEKGGRTEGEFQNGERSGRWVQWSLTREPRVEEHYVNGRLHGERRTYYENNRLASEEFYVNGLRQGESKTWTLNGRTATEEEWVNGQRHGTYRQWDDYGVLLARGSYSMGMPVGEWQWRNLNNEVIQSSNLEGGTGTFYQFVVTGESEGDRETTLRKEVPLRQGKIDGTQKSYYPDGTVQGQIVYQRGNRHGPFAEFDPAGRLKKEGEYQQDELVKMVDYHPSFRKEAPLVMSKEVMRERDGASVLVKEFSRRGELLSEMRTVNGKPDGSVKVYYPNGTVMREGSYALGQKVGLWKEYFENGELRASQDYAVGKEHGVAKEWFLKGEESSENQLAAEGRFVAGKRDGEWHYWYADGTEQTTRSYRYGLEEGPYREMWPLQEGQTEQQARVEGTFTLGEREGEWLTWFASGNLKSKATYRNGVQHGEAQEWYDIKKRKSQVVRVKGEFVDGQQEGKWFAYFPDGKIELAQEYRQGKLHGTVKQYYDTHVLKSESYYEEGVQEGLAVGYHPNGKPKSKANFSEGRLHGEFFLYHETGKVFTQGSYHRGMPTGSWRWFKSDGRTVLATSSFVEGSGKMYNFYPEGERKRETTFVKGVRSGIMTEWYRSGSKKVVSEWRQGLLHGDYREYHENGELQLETHYQNGRLQGEYQSWYGNGQPRLKLSYHQDTLDGRSNEWYENGVEKTSGVWADGVRQGTWTWFDRYGEELFEIEYQKGVVTRSTKQELEETAETAQR